MRRAGLLFALTMALGALPATAALPNRAILTVEGGVRPECSVSLDSTRIVADIFPLSGTTRTTGQPRVSFTCTNGATVSISGRGANVAGSCRTSSGALRSPSGDVLCYNLFDGGTQLSPRTTWVATGSGVASSFSLTFDVASSSTTREGTYSDVYTITFTAS